MAHASFSSLMLMLKVSPVLSCLGSVHCSYMGGYWNVQLLNRIKVFCYSFRWLQKFSYHNSCSYLAPRVNLACVLFHTQWNVVVVIIKCKYVPYVPTHLLWHKLSAGYRGKLEAHAISIIMHPHLQSYSVTNFGLIIWSGSIHPTIHACMHIIVITVFTFSLHVQCFFLTVLWLPMHVSSDLTHYLVCKLELCSSYVCC